MRNTTNHKNQLTVFLSYLKVIKEELNLMSRFNFNGMILRFIYGSRYLRHILFSNFYHLGTRVIFNKNINIYHADRISLGSRVFMYDNVSLRIHEESGKYTPPNIIIEDGVEIGPGSIISAAKSIHIEKNVLIGPSCYIGDHDHEYKDVKVPIRDQGCSNIMDVVIKEGVWIGANVIVCSGVVIGKNSAVGGNSVVLNDIPSFCLAVGAPAKVVKKFDPVSKKWKKVSKTVHN